MFRSIIIDDEPQRANLEKRSFHPWPTRTSRRFPASGPVPAYSPHHDGKSELRSRTM